jgi:hypothetical protein
VVQYANAANFIYHHLVATEKKLSSNLALVWHVKHEQAS